MTTQVKIENVNGPGAIEVRVMMKMPDPANAPGMSPPDETIEKRILVAGASVLYYAHSAQYFIVKET